MKIGMIILAVLATISSSASAASDSDKVCDSIGKTASSIMEQRQNGVPIGEMMSRVNQAHELIRDIARGMVIAAYDTPSFNSEAIKQKTIRDFSDRYQLECYKQFSK